MSFLKYILPVPFNFNTFPDYIYSNKIADLILESDGKLFAVRKLITQKFDEIIKKYSFYTFIFVDVRKYELSFEHIKKLNTELVDRGFCLVYYCLIDDIHKRFNFEDLSNPLKYQICDISIRFHKI